MPCSKTTYFILLLASVIYAQAENKDIPSASSGSITFYMDNAVFRGASGMSYLEIYLMLYGDELGGDAEPEFSVTLEIKDEKNIITEDAWVTKAGLSGQAVSDRTVIYDQWSSHITPGEYEAEVIIEDNNSDAIGRAASKIVIPEFKESGVSSSTIQFASEITDSETDSPFSKLNKTVIPNPSRRFGILKPVMYLHYELYNLPQEKPLEIEYTVRNNRGSKIKTYPPFELKGGKESAVINHGLSVAAFESGVYTVYANLISREEKIYTVSRAFEVIQPGFNNTKPVLDEEDAEIVIRYLQYIATPQQLSKFEKMNATGKAEFLVDFWRDLDPTPGTPENEYLKMIQSRYGYAENNYAWGKIPGWKSDRGRIFIKYGKPSQVDRHYAETGTVPYEIWIYEQDKQFLFVFADLQSNGKYTLLHSTREGEVENRSWQEEINRY